MTRHSRLIQFFARAAMQVLAGLTLLLLLITSQCVWRSRQFTDHTYLMSEQEALTNLQPTVPQHRPLGEKARPTRFPPRNLAAENQF